jgi:hypothetical protein
VFGPSVALILIGHGSAGSSNIFSRGTHGKTHTFNELTAYVSQCRPQVVVLFACEAGSFHPRSLMVRLVKWGAYHPGSVGADFSVFCCVDELSVLDSLFGIVGHFVYTLWAYLSQDGVFGTSAKQHVEMLLHEAHVKTKGGTLPTFVGKSPAVQVREVHALIVMAYSLFRQDAELGRRLQQTFHCVTTRRVGTRGFDASLMHAQTIREYGAAFYGSQAHSEWGMPENLGAAIRETQQRFAESGFAAQLRSHDVFELWSDSQTNQLIQLICTPDHDSRRASSSSEQPSAMDIDDGDSSVPMHFSVATSVQQKGKRWRKGPSKNELRRRRNKKRAQARRRARAQ